MKVLRVIVDGPGDGAWNMAVDRALLGSRQAGGRATLRLYRWARPTLSLGRFQDIGSVDLGECRRLGVDVVRRATGGRAVLHDDEVTYSVVASVDDGVPRGVAASYRLLCGALVEAYVRLGVAAELTRRDRGTKGSAACYLHATRADLSLGSAKLSGSAQVWAHDAVLQHGSFVVTRDVGMEAAVLGLDEAAKLRLSAETIAIADVLGERPGIEAVVEAVGSAFRDVLGVRLEPGMLTAEEAAAASRIVAATPDEGYT